jgi:hypothetical protein
MAEVFCFGFSWYFLSVAMAYIGKKKKKSQISTRLMKKRLSSSISIISY